jgi:hypothetical protein
MLSNNEKEIRLLLRKLKAQLGLLKSASHLAPDISCEIQRCEAAMADIEILAWRLRDHHSRRRSSRMQKLAH